MILDTMNLYEMRRYLRPVAIELCSYVSNVAERLQKGLKKGQKIIVTKKKKIDNIEWYVAFFIIKDKKLEKLGGSTTCSTYCIMRNIKGQDYVLCFNVQTNSVIKYSMHFFARYRERFLKNENIPLSEVIRTFFERNPFGKSKIISTGYISECLDGIEISNDKRKKDNCFKDNQIISYNTFLTREMLNKTQKENFLILKKEEIEQLDVFNVIRMMAEEGFYR